jgi:cytochrome c-type biogenesis protein CcmE
MQETIAAPARPANRTKFIVGGVLIVAAIAYLVFSFTNANAQFFLTLDELKAKGSAVANQDVRISGAVLGDSIQYDSKTLNLTFQVANIPGDNKEIEAQGGLAAVLHTAVTDTSRTRLTVVYNGPKPDLLKNEAQAIMTGKMGADGKFYASELLLKCPTKYEDAVPNQVTK